MKAIDITGQRFGRLVAIREVGAAGNDRVWLCKCDCGNEARATKGNLRGGRTKSCGCLNREATALRSTTHGHARPGRRTPEYRSWVNMRERCYRPKNKHFADYGGRGIAVCERWHSFENFISDIGEKPEPKHRYSLDRINVDGNYEPSNCRWATWREQNLNKRNSNLLPGAYRDGSSRWRAEIKIGDRRVRLGTFNTQEEASAAYMAAVANDNSEAIRRVAA